MRTSGVTTILANAALALVAIASLGTRLGEARWHHDAAYASLAAAALVAWPLLRRRRVTSVLLASLGAWSTLSGLLFVYVAPYTGGASWMRWWHGATSVGFVLVFLAHWARNNVRLVGLAKRLAARRRPALLVVGAWSVLALVGAASWGTPLRTLFVDDFFRDLSNVAFASAAFALVCAALALTGARLGPRLRETAFRNRLRAAVDASLLPTVWLVTATGLPLLYFSRALRAVDAYWLVAIWHVVLSAILLALVVAHLAFNGRILVAHARRIDRDLIPSR